MTQSSVRYYQYFVLELFVWQKSVQCICIVFDRALVSFIYFFPTQFYMTAKAIKKFTLKMWIITSLHKTYEC